MPVTITSRFTPLTYDEIARPLIEQTRAQQELENAYMETSDKAAQIMAQANQQTDPIAYQKMKSYSDDLRKQADALMRNGLQGNSRRGLLDMRRRYNSDIVPIEAAVKRREELATEQRKLAATNPDLLFERDLSTTSLDDFVRNPQLTYGRTYSGNQIQQDVERAIQAVSQSMGSIQMGGTLGNGMREIIQRTGMAPEEVESMIRAGVDANTIFGNIAQRAIGKSGVSEWGNVEAMNRAKNYAMQGFYSGYGKVDRRAIEDYDQRRRDALSDYQSRLNMQYAAQQRAAEEAAKKATEAGSSQGTDGNVWTQAPLYRVKGTGAAVWVRYDANNNPIYSIRGEKKGNAWPHTVIGKDMIENIPGKGNTIMGYNGVVAQHPDGQVSYTKKDGTTIKGWVIDPNDNIAIDHLNISDRQKKKAKAAWDQITRQPNTVYIWDGDQIQMIPLTRKLGEEATEEVDYSSAVGALPVAQ